MTDFLKKVKNIVGHAPQTIRGDTYDNFDDSKYADINAFEKGKIPEPKSALHKFWHGEGKPMKGKRGGRLMGGEDEYNDEDYPTVGGDIELRKKKTTSKPKRKPAKKCKCK